MEGAKHYESNARTRAPAPRRRGRGELADGAPRRAVPRAPSGDGRSQVRAARTLRSRVVDRRVRRHRPQHREPGSRRASHGLRRRSRPRRLRQRAVGDVGHRAARSRSRRGVHREVRRARAHVVRGDRVRRRSRRLEPRGLRAVRARRSAAASGGPTPGASFASSTDERRVHPLPPGEVGLLEVKPRRSTRDQWIRTTDLARLDDDGFLWIVGRSDQTIMRGGFKVQPDVVRAVLVRHPAVRGAAVFGIDDERLGQVPVAAVELREGPRPVRRAARTRSACTSPRTSCPWRSSSSTRCRGRPRQKSSSPRCERSSRTRSGRRRCDGGPLTFGEAPLPDVEALAAAIRESHQHRARTRATERGDPPDHRRGARRAPAIGPGSACELAAAYRSGCQSDQRVDVDHSRDVGNFNPCFPVYDLSCADDRGEGSVQFPLLYEGPPSIVHGGFLAVFFDCVLQQLNCDLGLAGKTASLAVRYRRPTPVLTPLHVVATREVDGDLIHSRAQLLLGDTMLCEAEMSAVAGNRTRSRRVAPTIGQVTLRSQPFQTTCP